MTITEVNAPARPQFPTLIERMLLAEKSQQPHAKPVQPAEALGVRVTLSGLPQADAIYSIPGARLSGQVSRNQFSLSV